MGAMLGAAGGQARSPAKATSSRENGRRAGGRERVGRKGESAAITQNADLPAGAHKAQFFHLTR